MKIFLVLGKLAAGIQKSFTNYKNIFFEQESRHTWHSIVYPLNRNIDTGLPAKDETVKTTWNSFIMTISRLN